MTTPTAPPPRFRPLSILPLAVSAICTLIIAQMAWKDPRYLVPCVLIIAVGTLPRLLARWRTKRLLLSGDVERVLGSWREMRVAYPETMAPLMAATAYASYGWIEAARKALTRAAKGPAWDAAVEQRLFIEALLDTFEGENEVAAQKVAALEALPVPPVGWLGRKRVTLLRRALGALVRAFSHASRDNDVDLLRKAAGMSPIVHWAMSYAAAIAAVDRGDAKRASGLLVGAPAWPADSAFRSFHEELAARTAGERLSPA